MKIIAVSFILMLCCRLAASGGGGRGEMDGEEQGKHDEKESRKVGGHPESNHVENHHGIPRQYYHDWGSSPLGSDGGGGGSDDGSG